MFIDGRSLPAGETLDADIAIVGAGAAGITLARALSGSGLKIALIESGGLEWSQAAQDLAAGELGEQTYGALDAVRLRQFGGTTGHWGGWCRELDPIDFEPRAHVPLSGWPIRKTDIAGYYAKAQPILQLGQARYEDSERVASELKAQLPISMQGDIEPVLFEMSPPTRMGEMYRAEIERADTVVAYLNLTVTDIGVSDDANRVTALTLARDGAGTVQLTARHVVLAGGGMSNPQMLLCADGQVRGGLGNARDQVGRYFAEHPILIGYGAVLSFGEPAGGPFAFSDIQHGPQRYRLAFQPSEAIRAAGGRLSALITIEPPGPVFDPVKGGFTTWDPRWYGAEEDVRAIMAVQGATSARVHVLNAGIETRPNADSRITLTDKRDRFGMRQIRFDWKLTAADLEDYLANLADFGRALMKSGAGIVRVAPDARDRWPAETAWGHHHMGATRMGDDPATSVCDRDCRVHGIANLWLAGSSVFTTPGACNPTLTIVALALRLADRLKQEMAA
jgi:choline dehydrogenase-like flavoprotein